MSIGHKELGQCLRNLRKQASQTVVQVADAVGTTHSHLSAIELGRIKSPRNQLMQSLDNHYGMTVSELTGESIGSDLSSKAQRVAYWFEHELTEKGQSAIVGMMEEMQSRS